MIDVKLDKEFLKELLETPSPSGQEEKATEVFKKFLEKNIPFMDLPLEFYKDKIGNYAYSIGAGKKKLLLSGHIDQVNARVSLIHDSGLLSIHYTGGIDNRCLPGSHLTILTDDGKEIDGIATKKPMHLDKDSEWPEDYRDMSQLKVDIGAETKEEVLAIGVHPGSLVCYRGEADVDFGKNRICGTSLDDKVAVFIVAEVLKALGKNLEELGTYVPDEHWSRTYQVIGLSTTQEETGLRGAIVATKNINPNYSIDIDVDFSTDDELTGPKEKIGDIKLGEGPIIAYGADKSIRLNNVLKNSAEEIGEKYQYASTGCGGTNTDVIQLYSEDCETTHLAIPLIGMHTPVEICNWKDIQSAVNILYNSIVNCKI